MYFNKKLRKGIYGAFFVFIHNWRKIENAIRKKKEKEDRKMEITSDIKYIGVNDHSIDLFEGIYKVPNGMAYNSYVIMDEKIAVLDTVDEEFTKTWFDNLENVLKGRMPDYLIVQHMEPDHSANIVRLLEKYPDTILIATAKAFDMIKNYFGDGLHAKQLVVKDGEDLSLGKHKLTFISAPMVHWPEVMVTYDETDKVLFSADGFGKFGALDVKDCWVKEARRYYFGIVGKYGVQVNMLLKKLEGKDIRYICSLHGPVLKGNVETYIQLYKKWAFYEPEEDGVLIAFSSVYGNTKEAVYWLKDLLKEGGCKQVEIYDLARSEMSEVVAEAFRFSKLVLATTTYNGGLFPAMREYINNLTEREFQNRTVALIENGSWAPIAGKMMKERFEKSKNIKFLEPCVKITSVMNESNRQQIRNLAQVLCDKNIKM